MSCAASVIDEPYELMTATTPSATMRWAVKADWRTSPWSSPITSSTGRPRMPPRALIWSTTIRTELTAISPSSAHGPVIGPCRPIRIGCCALAGTTPARPSAKPRASTSAKPKARACPSVETNIRRCKKVPSYSWCDIENSPLRIFGGVYGDTCSLRKFARGGCAGPRVGAAYSRARGGRMRRRRAGAQGRRSRRPGAVVAGGARVWSGAHRHRAGGLTDGNETVGGDPLQDGRGLIAGEKGHYRDAGHDGQLAGAKA